MSEGKIKYETLMLGVAGMFEMESMVASCIKETGMHITNQPGFNFVVNSNETFFTAGQLNPKIIDWLENHDTPSFEVKPGVTITRLETPPNHTITEKVNCTSVHHRDER